MPDGTHSAVVKIGVDAESAEAYIVIECLECASTLEVEIPAVHLATLGHACLTAAARLGMMSRQDEVTSDPCPTDRPAKMH